ncbi:pyridoxal phosphate-dependent aminotransferase [Sulfurimonas sediminis]|uniref:cysteine-S-conjugate beta-lyase n=1 Tax=Sulfurimonas sediminis TaxID=2590020 RepID=A0A7M1B3A4_9BACT|nr:pyridoxal phosphate-dependent aminotransferase [Sulfurimonas sediminis]QOP44135.1 pyridoxal phosphate-dependent aminotransferase [Sulfurimonas sediminis]
MEKALKKYSFETASEREGTNAEKYVLRKQLFGTDDVLPVWVADMDIDTPSCVLDAVKKRLQHPIIGYEEVPASAYQAQIDWVKHEHGMEFYLDDMLYSHSVVASMHTAIEAFTKEGDGVIVQTPVYPPFFHSVLQLNRKLIKNSLHVDKYGEYSFDIEDFKAKIDENTKLLLLCSPHNPVGRVWKKKELKEILEVCIEHNIVVFADEIHSDLVYKPFKHTVFASLDERAKDITVTALGVGKTFNMAGFAMSTVAIANEELRKQFKKAYEKVHFAQGCVLSHVAFETAYREAKEWLEALKIHLYYNYLMLNEIAKKYSKYIKVTPIEATYLAWLDCRGMGIKDKELRAFFINEAKLGLNAGISFGREGSGYMRLNFAVSSAKMREIVQRLERALQRREIG